MTIISLAYGWSSYNYRANVSFTVDFCFKELMTNPKVRKEIRITLLFTPTPVKAVNERLCSIC